MDAWLSHLHAIHSPRPTTRVVVGGAEATPSVSFDSHLADALAEQGQGEPAHSTRPAWGDVYLREAGLLFGAPTVAAVADDDQPARARRVDPTHAA